jgi:hypothetical protein
MAIASVSEIRGAAAVEAASLILPPEAFTSVHSTWRASSDSGTSM